MNFFRSLLLGLCLLPASATAHPILILGDSLSAAYGMAREASWVSLLQQELRRSHPAYTVVNASISGETTAGGLRRLPRALEEHRPAIVILELGANDALRGMPLHETEKNLHTMIRLAKQAGARVLLLGIQIPPNYGPDYARRFRELYPRVAKEQRIALLPFMLEGIPESGFQADNLHPTAAAQRRILENVLPALLPLLNAR